MHTEIKTASESIFTGQVFNVTLDTVTLENGKPATREVVHHNGGACVVALNDNNEIALVRQFRYAQNREVIELPAGKIEIGEDPQLCAVRELREEAGCEADTVSSLGSVVPTCAYCTEVIYIYLATGLHNVPQDLDDDEFLDVFWMDLEQAAQKVLQNEIVDSKTVSGILKAYTLQKQGKL